MLDDGEKEINNDQQERLMDVLRGELDIEELPNQRVINEPSGGMGELLSMLRKKR